MSEKKDVDHCDPSIHMPIKSFAEITSCHTINISDNFPCDCREDSVAAPPSGEVDVVNRGNKGVKRQRGESVVTSSFKQGHSIQYLHDSAPEVGQNFDVISKIGEGTFSSVYLAKVKDSSLSKVALKHLIPTSSTTRIENEIKCLKLMGGRANVIELKACIRHRDHVVLIMPYFPHDKFIDYLPTITLSEVRLYMSALFQALRNVHSHHIMHRDIKPSNFLYHRETRRFRLVDFGLAQLESGRSSDNNRSRKPSTSIILSDTFRRQSSKRVAARKMNSTEKQTKISCLSKHQKDEVCNECQSRKGQVAPRAGTPGFRAPEVLVKCPNQTTAIDIWSAGVIFLSLLSGRYPFFRAHDDASALAQIISLVGSEECASVTDVLGKELVCEPEVKPVDLKQLCHSLRSSKDMSTNPAKKLKQCNGIATANETITDKANSSGSSEGGGTPTEGSWDDTPDCVYDLLKLCLDLNPRTRVTANQALSHPFFTGKIYDQS